VHVGSGSVSATLVKSLKNNSASKEDYLVYACGMVCEYLDERLTTVLSQEYRLLYIHMAPLYIDYVMGISLYLLSVLRMLLRDHNKIL
jgi:hypothetical protein